MSRTGIPPKCLSCGSLERHRVLRQVWDYIGKDFLANKKVLQFSPDPSVSGQWFGVYEVSVFGGLNSLDLQAIDRDDANYDIVLCNHVLEHVQDDSKAFNEIIRVLKPNGFLQMTVPNPARISTTEDWGFADPKLHGHFRNYGIDFIQKFNDANPSVKMFYVDSADPVTGMNDYVFFYSRSASVLSRLDGYFKDHFEIFSPFE